MIIVYAFDILKVATLNLKMDPATNSPLEPMLQVDLVIFWALAVQKAVF